MMEGGVGDRGRRIGVPAALVLLASGAFALAVSRAFEADAARWCLAGWAVMGAIGLAAAFGLGRFHGRPGTGFPAVLVASMLARLAAAAAGAFSAASAGRSSTLAYVAGLACGYVPLQVFEGFWFWRRSGGSAAMGGRTTG